MQHTFKAGDRVRLARVHHNMGAHLRGHLGEAGTVLQVINITDVQGRGVALEYLQKHYPQVQVKFDSSDCCYGIYYLRPRYLEPETP